MVRIIYKILLIPIIFISCYKEFRNSEGLLRMDYTKLNKENCDNNVYKFLDTASIYKFIYYRDNNNKELHSNYNYTSYIKFYDACKYGLFVIPKNTTITKSNFNPKSAKMGAYYINDNKIQGKLFTRGDGSSIIIKERFTSKKDTIIINDSQNIIMVYIKDQTIPKEWLQGWKPDW